MEKYHIGDIDFVWETADFPFKQDEFMRQFLKKDDVQISEAVHYEMYKEDLGKYTCGQLLQQNGLYELYQLPKGKFIIYHWATLRLAFGFWLEDLERSDKVRFYYSPQMKNQIPLDTVRFFSCAGMHSKLLQREGVVFHSSYIEWNEKAILFAGASGIGKSTQADLWVQCEHAQLINGDRTLIRKKNDTWMAYGYPCCGSSAVCVNRTLPIAAIVILEQGLENRIEIIKEKQKICSILTGSEIYRWNINEIDRVCQVASKMIKEIPIVKLVCRQDREAVRVLKNWVRGEIYGKNF